MQTVDLEKKLSLVEFSHALSSAGDDLGRYPALQTHAEAFKSLAHDLLLPPIVVVMGAFNAGKSTLLNALLGQNLLNMHVLPATATVTMLRKGKPGTFYSYTDGQPARTWPASDLVSLSAEGDAMTGIRRSLSYIEVPLEVPLLDKVTLVDTPGLNSPNEAHTKATEEFVHRAHTVLWIVSCLSALNEHERSWIEGLPNGLKVMVVINQIDLLDPEESSLARVIERIQNNLQRPNVTVTAVSAKLALESRLQKNPMAHAESLWERFEADFDKQIVHSSSEPQFELAIRKATALFESVEADIRKHLAEADGFHITAKGGNEYHEKLQARIDGLADAEYSLVHGLDATQTVGTFKIPIEWGLPERLRLQQEVLTGALVANDSEQSQVDLEQKSLDSRADLYERDYCQLQTEAEAYKKSGIFGREPIIFDGKKKKLEGREQWLTERSERLSSEQQVIRTRQKFLYSRVQRVENDCSSYVAELVVAIRLAMSVAVRESHDTVGQQKIAAQELGELRWLSSFAFEIRQKSSWTLKGWGEATVADSAAKVSLSSAVHTFSKTIERVLAQTWSLNVPEPLVEPKALRKIMPEERLESTVRLKASPSSKSLGVFTALVAIVVLGVFFFRPRPETPPQQSSVAPSQTKPLPSLATTTAAVSSSGPASTDIPSVSEPTVAPVQGSPSETSALDGASSQGGSPALGITQSVNEWAKAEESNDPDRIAHCYAEHIDRFFLKLNVTNSFVRDYMQAWLVDGNRHVTTFSPEDLTIDMKTSTFATISLTKHVMVNDSRGAGEYLTRSQLSMEKIGDEWKITSERDLK